MTRHVALLRGINVGGKNLIGMPALKAFFEAQGFADVVTYIQSGNVVFTSNEQSSVLVADRSGTAEGVRLLRQHRVAVT